MYEIIILMCFFSFSFFCSFGEEMPNVLEIRILNSNPLFDQNK